MSWEVSSLDSALGEGGLNVGFGLRMLFGRVCRRKGPEVSWECIRLCEIA